MPATPLHREEIVRTAARLFRRQGYAATGTNQIVAESGAPKGSLYHYFPGGKEQIAEAAVRHAGDVVAATLADLLAAEATPGAALRAYAGLLVGWLRESDFRDGSPLTTALLELAPAAAGVTEAGRRAFARWIDLLDRALRAGGVPATRAHRLATLAVAALDGGLVQARVAQDGRPLLDALGEVADLFDTAGSR